MGDKQEGCRKGQGCVDKISTLKIIVEKYLEENKKLFAAFIGLRESLSQA